MAVNNAPSQRVNIPLYFRLSLLNARSALARSLPWWGRPRLKRCAESHPIQCPRFQGSGGGGVPLNFHAL